MAAMREGTMAAVMGLDGEALRRLCSEVEGTVVVANLNAPGQVVVSGSSAAVAELSERAQRAGARRVVPLRVSGAFHSPLMEEAAAGFARVLDAATFASPTVPVVANLDASPVREAGAVRERLGRQMVSPVRWSESVTRLVELGAQALVEVGPGSVLTGLARRIVPGVPALSVSSLAGWPELGGKLEAASGG